MNRSESYRVIGDVTIDRVTNGYRTPGALGNASRTGDVARHKATGIATTTRCGGYRYWLIKATSVRYRTSSGGVNGTRKSANTTRSSTATGMTLKGYNASPMSRAHAPCFNGYSNHEVTSEMAFHAFGPPGRHYGWSTVLSSTAPRYGKGPTSRVIRARRTRFRGSHLYGNGGTRNYFSPVPGKTPAMA